jgi:hypothetical protein
MKQQMEAVTALTVPVVNGWHLVAVIELHSDDSRWHVIRNGKDIANYATRQDALASLRGAS